MTTTTTPVKAGDVFTCSWGYDQTNVDFYAVTKVSTSGKTAEFIRVAGAHTDRDGGPSAVYKVADATAAICKNCMRAIRPLTKMTYNGAGTLVPTETLWRHVTTGETLCYTETICVVGGDNYRKAREGREQCFAEPETFRRTLKVYGADVWAKVTSYSSMKRWDGHAMYETALGWGH